MRKYFILFALIVVQGCSSDGGGDSVDNTSPSLADIAGVWDTSVTTDGLTDETYQVVKTNGTLVVYDYMGDSFDNLANCYNSFTLTISDLGGGDFLIEDTLTLHFTISNGNLIPSEDGVTSPLIPPSSLLESDFSPICS